MTTEIIANLDSNQNDFMTQDEFDKCVDDLNKTLEMCNENLGKIEQNMLTKVDIANLNSDIHKSFITETRWYLGIIVSVVVIGIVLSIQINNAITSFNQSNLNIPVEVTQQSLPEPIKAD